MCEKRINFNLERKILNCIMQNFPIKYDVHALITEYAFVVIIYVF